MAETVTNRGKFRAANVGVPNFTSPRMLVILGTATGVNDPDLNTVADLDAVSGVSIHSERVALANVTVTEDDTNNRVNLDCDAVTFAAAPGVTAVGVAIYEHTGTDSTSNLFSIHTTGFPQPMDGGLVVNIADFARNA